MIPFTVLIAVAGVTSKPSPTLDWLKLPEYEPLEFTAKLAASEPRTPNSVGVPNAPIVAPVGVS